MLINRCSELRSSLRVATGLSIAEQDTTFSLPPCASVINGTFIVFKGDLLLLILCCTKYRAAGCEGMSGNCNYLLAIMRGILISLEHIGALTL